MTRNEDYLAVAKATVMEHHPDAACAFVAGSIVTGHGTPSSDIDLIVLYNDQTHETYRQSFMCQGWPVEMFVHNIKSQDYFFAQDRTNGHCSTLNMIATGHPIGHDLALAQQRKDIAAKLIAHGPEPLSQDKIDNARYFITDLFDDLRHPKDIDYIPGILSELFGRLGEFYLRTQGKWSGKGKQLVKILKREEPVFATEFLAAFDAALGHDLAGLEELTGYVLQPYGGWLFEGYKSISNSWRN